jgi:hypothetical protein
MNRFVSRRCSGPNKYKKAQIRRYSNTRSENITNRHFYTTCVTSNTFFPFRQNLSLLRTKFGTKKARVISEQQLVLWCRRKRSYIHSLSIETMQWNVSAAVASPLFRLMHPYSCQWKLRAFITPSQRQWWRALVLMGRRLFQHSEID